MLLSDEIVLSSLAIPFLLGHISIVLFPWRRSVCRRTTVFNPVLSRVHTEARADNRPPSVPLSASAQREVQREYPLDYDGRCRD
jgi:hypothetical protein